MKWIKWILMFSIILNAQKIDLNFQNLKITDFIKMVSKISNKNILITDNIRGNVDFISVKPVDETEVFDILLNILKSKGFTLINEKGYFKLIRINTAFKEAPSLNSSNNQIQTTIIKIKNLYAKDIYSQINYLKSRYGKIIVNNNQNMLIITDYTKNITTIKALIDKIDNKQKQDILFIKLKYTSIEKIYSKILDIAHSLYDNRIYKYKILKNENNNGVILIAPKNILGELSNSIKQLDIKPSSLDQVTKIITLKNSDVSNMIKVISKIVDMKYKKNKPSITENKETNSLIIIGSQEQINTIQTIIQALDIPKQQVYVKARILEISNLKASKIGTKFGLLAGSSGSSGLYTMSANMGAGAIAFDTSALGVTLPTLQQGIALGATLDLLENFGAAKKLSEPSLLCINNTPSSIYVGKTVSVKTGQTTSTSTSVSYSRQDIGLTLNITPRIDNDNKVSLNVKTIIEDILPGSPDMTLPTTSKRDIQTTTIVNNGQSIIIGGLIRNNKDVTIQKVPFLGDIPFLGALFRHKEINEDQTTLAIILTPYIIKKSDDLNKLKKTFAKLNKLEKQFLDNFLKKAKNEKN